MAIFNIRYLEEKYISKYASFANEDDDNNEEPTEKKSTTERDLAKKNKHLSKEEISKVINVTKVMLSNYPKLKKCCDYVNLSDKDKINEDGKRESSFDHYYDGKATEFLELMDGDVWSGYPNFRNGGNEDFQEDCEEFIFAVNEKLKEMKISARFKSGPDRDDEAISFGIKSTKME